MQFSCSLSQFVFTITTAGKPTGTVTTKGENINICWSPDGHTIAVGNKVSHYDIIINYYSNLKEDLLTFIDARTLKVTQEELFKYEVNINIIFKLLNY